MKKNWLILTLIFLPYLSLAEESTHGYRTVKNVYLNGTKWTHFYLDQECTQAKKYYTLNPKRVDVERFYSLALAAFMAGKKLRVYYETTPTFCEVTRMFVQ